MGRHLELLELDMNSLLLPSNHIEHTHSLVFCTPALTRAEKGLTLLKGLFTVAEGVLPTELQRPVVTVMQHIS